MVQAGCPHSRDPHALEAGTGGPAPASVYRLLTNGAVRQRNRQGCISDEFVSRDSNVFGTLSMANKSTPDSGGSQFFVNVRDNTFLDWWDRGTESNHPVFGRIIEGIDQVVAISRVATKNDNPIEPIKIESISIDGSPDWAEGMPRDELYLTPIWLRTHPNAAAQQ